MRHAAAFGGRPVRGAMMLAVLVLAACGGKEAPAREAVWDSSTALYFPADDGSAVEVPAGSWFVGPRGGTGLRLVSAEDEIVEIAARVGEHALRLETPQAVLESRGGVDTLVLLLPDGTAREASGGRTPAAANAAKTDAASEGWRYAVAYALDRVTEGGDLPELVPDGLLRQLDAFRSLLEGADGLVAAGATDEDRLVKALDARVALARAGARLERSLTEYVRAGAAAGSPGFLNGLDSAGGELRAAAGESRARVDEALVYYGDPRRYDRPALVDVDRAYAVIPEYAEVVERDLDPSDPRYLMLLRIASRKFLGAVRAVARKEDHDLVGGLKAISPRDGVPEITKATIARLKE